MAAQVLSPTSSAQYNSLGHWQTTVRSQLEPISKTASLDAWVLLAHTLSRSKTWVLAHPEYLLSSQEIKGLTRALDRLTAGEPLPYVLGRWAFYGLDFQLSSQVLIPRPETEILVEKALAWLTTHPHRRQAADLGTGSGCIAVTLAKHMPDLRVLATDVSLAALHTARENAHTHQVIERLDFIQGDLLDPIQITFDLICANLPYIPTQVLKELDVYQREPTLALDGGPDGLSKIRQLIASAPAFLAPGGLLLLEIEASQGPALLALVPEHLPDARVTLWPDLAGHDRLVAVELL